MNLIFRIFWQNRILEFCETEGRNYEELLPAVQFTYQGEVTSKGGHTYARVEFAVDETNEEDGSIDVNHPSNYVNWITDRGSGTMGVPNIAKIPYFGFNNCICNNLCFHIIPLRLRISKNLKKMLYDV